MTGEDQPFYGFAGREFDKDLGLYFNRTRWYDPESGRFITEDWAGVIHGPNRYTYPTNPITFNDPFGMDGGPIVAGGAEPNLGPTRPSILDTLIETIDNSDKNPDNGTGEWSNPFIHCLNICTTTKNHGPTAGKFLGDAMEWWQMVNCKFLGAGPGTCNSADQGSDYKDNATGVECASKPGSCFDSCVKALGGTCVPEGPNTPRSFGPNSVPNAEPILCPNGPMKRPSRPSHHPKSQGG